MKEDLVSADCLATSLQLVIVPTQEAQEASRDGALIGGGRYFCYKREAVQWSLDSYDFLVQYI